MVIKIGIKDIEWLGSRVKDQDVVDVNSALNWMASQADNFKPKLPEGSKIAGTIQTFRGVEVTTKVHLVESRSGKLSLWVEDYSHVRGEIDQFAKLGDFGHGKDINKQELL